MVLLSKWTVVCFLFPDYLSVHHNLKSFIVLATTEASRRPSCLARWLFKRYLVSGSSRAAKKERDFVGVVVNSNITASSVLDLSIALIIFITIYIDTKIVVKVLVVEVMERATDFQRASIQFTEIH